MPTTLEPDVSDPTDFPISSVDNEAGSSSPGKIYTYEEAMGIAPSKKTYTYEEAMGIASPARQIVNQANAEGRQFSSLSASDMPNSPTKAYLQLQEQSAAKNAQQADIAERDRFLKEAGIEPMGMAENLYNELADIGRTAAGMGGELMKGASLAATEFSKMTGIQFEGAEPGSVDVKDTHLYQLGDWVQKKAEGALTVDPRYEDSTTSKIVQTATQIGSFIMPGVAGEKFAVGLGKAVPAIMGFMFGAGRTYDEAKSMGANENDSVDAAFKNGLNLAATFSIPVGRFLDRLNAVTGGGLKATLAKIGGDALINAATFGTSKIVENAIFKDKVDPNRPLSQGVMETASIQGAIGAFMSTLAHGAQIPAMRAARDEIAGGQPAETGQKTPAMPTIQRSPEKSAETPSISAVTVPDTQQKPLSKRERMFTPESIRAFIQLYPEQAQKIAAQENPTLTDFPAKMGLQRIDKPKQRARFAQVLRDQFKEMENAQRTGGTAEEAGPPQGIEGEAAGQVRLRNNAENGVETGTGDAQLSDTGQQTQTPEVVTKSRGLKSAAIPQAPGETSAATEGASQAVKNVGISEKSESVDPVAEFLYPGMPLESMGAAPNPSFEVGLSGKIRPKATPPEGPYGTGKEPSSSDIDIRAVDALYNEKMESARAGRLDKSAMNSGWKRFKEFVARNFARGASVELPRAKFGQARMMFEKRRNAEPTAIAHTEQAIKSTIAPLSDAEQKLFTAKVFYDDMANTIKAQQRQHAKTGKKGVAEILLPFDLTSESVRENLAKADSMLNDRIRDALDYRQKYNRIVVDSFVNSNLKLGKDYRSLFYEMDADGNVVQEGGKPKLDNDAYYRHDVLEKNLSRMGMLKSRKGSKKDINLNYVQTEFMTMANLHAAALKAQYDANIKNHYDIRAQLELDAAQKGEPWESLVPETHEIINLGRGGRAATIGDLFETGVNDAVLNSVSKELGIPREILEKAMDVPLPNTAVLPKEIVAQYKADQRAAMSKPGFLSKIVTVPTRYEKMAQLLGPHRLIPFNIRNPGEIDKVFAFNISALRRVPEAFKETFNLIYRPKMASAEARHFLDSGSQYSLYRLADIEKGGAHSNIEQYFNELSKSKFLKIAGAPKKLWHTYWNEAGRLSDWRELVLRLANHLEYLDQIRQGNGRPKNYGASLPAEIDTIVDYRDKAYKLSSDLLGNYSDAPPVIQSASTGLFPYIKFKWLNGRAWSRGLMNVANSETISTRAGAKVLKSIGLGAAAKAPMLALRVGRANLRLLAVYGAAEAWNNVMAPLIFGKDLERMLDPERRKRPHIITGIDKDGQVTTFNRFGSAMDFLDVFGMDTVWHDIRDIMDGRQSLKEWTKNIAWSPVNATVNQINGLIKFPVEVFSKKTSFPDVRYPKIIRDNWEQFFRIMGADEEYRRLAGRPQRFGYPESFTRGIESHTDPGDAAYNYIKARQFKFMAKYGQGHFEPGQKSNALYYYKLAMRYNDKQAAVKYLHEYLVANGGSFKGIKQSIKMASPEYMPGKFAEFMDSLNNEDKEMLNRAIAYYRDLYGENYSALQTDVLQGVIDKVNSQK